MKKLSMIFTTMMLSISVSTFAYYGENSKTAKYYNGEISVDEYLDSLGCPPKNQPPTTIIHSNGKKTIVQPGVNGQGTIYHSNGNKSVYYSN